MNHHSPIHVTYLHTGQDSEWEQSSWAAGGEQGRGQAGVTSPCVPLPPLLPELRPLAAGAAGGSHGNEHTPGNKRNE